MTIDSFSVFSPCLRYRSPGNAPAWDDGCAVYYFAALSEIPDADAPIVMKAIMTGGCGKFRPDPDEVLALWRKITRPAPPLAEEIAGKILQLRREKGPQSRRIEGDPCCRWEFYEPVWSDPVMARVSLAMGGWTAFCEDDSPSGVLRGQLLKIAGAIVQGEADTVVTALRLEYEASRPAPLLIAPKKPKVAAEEDAEEDADQQPSRYETAQIMAGIEKRVPVNAASELAAA